MRGNSSSGGKSSGSNGGRVNRNAEMQVVVPTRSRGKLEASLCFAMRLVSLIDS